MYGSPMFKRDVLIRAMQKAGVGPQSLALSAGISRGALWSIMTGRGVPKFPTAKRLADALGLDPLALWGDDERAAP